MGELWWAIAFNTQLFPVASSAMMLQFRTDGVSFLNTETISTNVKLSDLKQIGSSLLLISSWFHSDVIYTSRTNKQCEETGREAMNEFLSSNHGYRYDRIFSHVSGEGGASPLLRLGVLEC